MSGLSHIQPWISSVDSHVLLGIKPKQKIKWELAVSSSPFIYGVWPQLLFRVVEQSQIRPYSQLFICQKRIIWKGVRWTPPHLRSLQSLSIMIMMKTHSTLFSWVSERSFLGLSLSWRVLSCAGWQWGFRRRSAGQNMDVFSAVQTW